MFYLKGCVIQFCKSEGFSEKAIQFHKRGTCCTETGSFAQLLVRFHFGPVIAQIIKWSGEECIIFQDEHQKGSDF